MRAYFVLWVVERQKYSQRNVPCIIVIEGAIKNAQYVEKFA